MLKRLTSKILLMLTAIKYVLNKLKKSKCDFINALLYHRYIKIG
jgi:hypothetical protein